MKAGKRGLRDCGIEACIDVERERVFGDVKRWRDEKRFGGGRSEMLPRGAEKVRGGIKFNL